MKEKFDIKETLRRNFRQLTRLTFTLILFFIGLHAITKSTDPLLIIFLTLGWVYIFFRDFFRRFSLTLVFKNEKGDTFEY